MSTSGGPEGSDKSASRWASWAVRASIVFAAFAVVVAGLALPPSFEAPAASAPTLAAGHPGVDGAAIEAFRATYATRTRVLGIPVKTGEVVMTAELHADSLVGTFAGSLNDRVVLDRRTLAPLYREFPTQSFDFRGRQVIARVDRGEATDTLEFNFPEAPFEVSLLEWIAIGMGPDGARAARVAWDNFGDPDGALAELHRAPATKNFAGGTATERVDVRFADGRIRRFWLSHEPPYKLHQTVFETGRLVVSTWELLDFERVAPTVGTAP